MAGALDDSAINIVVVIIIKNTKLYWHFCRQSRKTRSDRCRVPNRL